MPSSQRQQEPAATATATAGIAVVDESIYPTNGHYDTTAATTINMTITAEVVAPNSTTVTFETYTGIHDITAPSSLFQPSLLMPMLIPMPMPR